MNKWAQGKGPGPKNVGIYIDGKKTVTTYRRYKELMADTKYVSAAGFVQFDPRERDANGQTVVDYTIKTPGTDGVLIRITVWPEMQAEVAKKGDFLAADGKLTIGSYQGQDGVTRQSVQITASQLAIVPGLVRREREVVNQGADAERLF